MEHKRSAFLLVLHNLTLCAMYCRPIHVGDDHNHNSSAGSVLKIDDTDLSDCTNLNFLFNTCSGNSFDSMLKSMLYICSTLGKKKCPMQSQKGIKIYCELYCIRISVSRTCTSYVYVQRTLRQVN